MEENEQYSLKEELEKTLAGEAAEALRDRDSVEEKAEGSQDRDSVEEAEGACRKRKIYWKLFCFLWEEP